MCGGRTSGGDALHHNGRGTELTMQELLSRTTLWKGQCVQPAPHILKALQLLSILQAFYGQVNSMEGRLVHKPKAEQQIDCIVRNSGFRESSKDMLANEKATADSSRHVQSVRGCHALNVRSWSGQAHNCGEGTSGYAKPSNNAFPAADSVKACYSGPNVRSNLWNTALANDFNFDFLHRILLKYVIWNILRNLMCVRSYCLQIQTY